MQQPDTPTTSPSEPVASSLPEAPPAAAAIEPAEAAAAAAAAETADTGPPVETADALDGDGDADISPNSDVSHTSDHSDPAPADDPALAEAVATGVAGAPAVPTPAELTPAQCSARLGELFPALFRLQQPLPLKLRIQADIQARAPGIFTRKSLSGFLHRYTTGTPYLLALTRQTQRFDLDGQPAGELAAEHREAATTEMARRRAIVDERRAAERTAERAAQRQAEAAQREAQAAQRQQHEADQQGRRERALLLRAFETSTLTRANFCALKGLAESGLDAVLAQARQEAAERPAWADDRPPRRDEGRRPPPPGAGAGAGAGGGRGPGSGRPRPGGAGGSGGAGGAGRAGGPGEPGERHGAPPRGPRGPSRPR